MDFEKKVLSKTDRLKRMDVTGYWRKIHNERFQNLDCTSKYLSVYFEKKVLSKIDGLERMDITESWRKIHKERFHNSDWTSKYRSGDVTRRKTKEIGQLEDLRVNGCIILKRILTK
jgi:predicted small secreted protein